MQCTNPIELNPELRVPCGKCMSCRVAYRRQWSARMVQEMPYHNRHLFLTLTYKDDKLPENGSLRKTDLQKFIKRIRKELSYNDRTIKYFSVGEYGEQTQRPHYHSIIYGMGPHPEDKDLIISQWPLADWKLLPINGKKSPFGNVTRTSIQYVAQYVDKKFTGDMAIEEYYKTGREPVFRLISQGIGKQYCLDNAEQLAYNKHISLNGAKMTLPRYYIDLLRKKDQEDNWFIFDDSDLEEQALQKEMETVEQFTGVRKTIHQAKRDPEINKKYFKDFMQKNKQRERNLARKSSLKRNREIE